MFIDPDEGGKIIEGYLSKFRDALFVLSDDQSLGLLNGARQEYERFGFLDTRREYKVSETLTDKGEAVIDYLDSRAFFFKSDSGFGSIAGDLGLSLSAVRSVLREEETAALTDGKLLDTNLHHLRPAAEWVTSSV